ncbi:MAG: ribonuclease H [Flavobacteriaceae bacterium]|nr:ribonuclease H [Flavobacteriaceae bacterium]
MIFVKEYTPTAIEMDRYHVYTDGACKFNPGKGGWGWVKYKLLESGTVLEFFDYGGKRETTNNQMELTAIIEFLKNAPMGSSYLIHSDSMYCLKGLVRNGNGVLIAPGKYSGWMKGWLIKGFKKNAVYWKTLDDLIRKHLSSGTKLEFKYVKGHSGDMGNDRADELANMGVP